MPRVGLVCIGLIKHVLLMNFYRLHVIQKALVQVHNALCLLVWTEISVSKEK